jgi:hypothetical protein
VGVDRGGFVPQLHRRAGGLPTGWTSLTVPSGGKQYKGYMSDYAAVMPAHGGFRICPVEGGRMQTKKYAPNMVFDTHVAAIVAAELMWPRK